MLNIQFSLVHLSEPYCLNFGVKYNHNEDEANKMGSCKGNFWWLDINEERAWVA